MTDRYRFEDVARQRLRVEFRIGGDGSTAVTGFPSVNTNTERLKRTVTPARPSRTLHKCPAVLWTGRGPSDMGWACWQDGHSCPSKSDVAQVPGGFMDGQECPSYMGWACWQDGHSCPSKSDVAQVPGGFMDGQECPSYMGWACWQDGHSCPSKWDVTQVPGGFMDGQECPSFMGWACW